jgi:hypothetical protein
MANSLEEQQQLAAAFDASNAIANLDGIPFTAGMAEMQRRIIIGELSFQEAVDLIKLKYIALK